MQKMDITTVFSHIICYPVVIDGFVFALLVTFKHHQAVRKATPYLNATSLFLMLFVVIQIVSVLRVEHAAQQEITENIELASVPAGDLPDIYYIVLDGYSRADWLQEEFAYDNSAFVDALAERGFYVADKSCSNYGITILSIPSTLNMTYFDKKDVARWGGNKAYNYLALYARKHNRVGQAFNDLGYTYVHFLTGFPVTDRSPVEGVLIDFGPDGPFETKPSNVNQFLNVFLPTTLYLPFFTYQEVTRGNSYDSFSPNRVLAMLDELTKIPERDEPTLTVAHIIKPHYPYSFDREGNILPKPAGWVPEDDTKLPNADQAYADQVAFLNTRLLEVVDEIVAKSDQTPIIILQGDHGWRHHDARHSPERVMILNAYLVPEATRAQLYPGITPVNSFRLILDTVFGTHLGLLPDESYPSPEDDPFALESLTGDMITRCDQG
jgi:hypothetical protein